MKVIVRLTCALLLLLLGYALGVNQSRIGNWLADRGYLKEVFSQAARDREKLHKQNVALWVENLKKGGYIIFLRHANREKWPETTAFDVYELESRTEDASQTSFKRAVCLSEQGVEEAKLIGKIFQLAKIPTGTIVSSPSCRAKQTVVYAFGKYDYVDSSIRFPEARSESPGPKSANRLISLLQKVEIKPGTNTVISGHSVNLEQYRGHGLVAPMADVADPLETGFKVIERREDNTLAVVFTVKSISDLTSARLGAVIGSK